MTNISGQGARWEGWLPFQGRPGSRWKSFRRPADLRQNGPSLRRADLKYRHIPASALLALSRFASNLDGVIYEFTA